MPKETSAKEIFSDFCTVLDNKGWVYDKDEENLQLRFKVRGEDIPADVIVYVDEKNKLICASSPMPFKMPADMRVEGALAACSATYSLADGYFDYDIMSGQISFRMTALYHDSAIGNGLCKYIIDCTVAVTDMYNDKFLAVAQGEMSIDEFISTT